MVGAQRPGPVVVQLDGAQHPVDVGFPELRVFGVAFDFFHELERLVDVLGRQAGELEAAEHLPDRLLELDDLQGLEIRVLRLPLPALARLVELAELVGGRDLQAAARQLLLEVADAVGRLLEPLLLALVEAVKDGARAEVAARHGGEDLGMGEAVGHPALERAHVVEEPGRDEVFELLGARHVGGELVESPGDRRNRRRIDPGPDRGRGRGLQILPGIRAPASRAGVVARPRRDDRGEEVDLVDDVLVDVGLREVEPQKVEGDLLVLRLNFLEEAAHVRGRDEAVGLAQLARERVETLRQLTDPGRDLLGRSRVDRSRDGAHVVVETSRNRARNRAPRRRTSSGLRAGIDETSTAP